MGSLGSILRMAGIMQQASFLGGIFGSGEKKAGIATEATFDYHPFKLHQLDEGPATTTSISRDEALRIYRETGPSWSWHRLCSPVQGRWRCQLQPVRRWCCQPGPGLRGLQLGKAVEPACSLHL